MASNVTSIEKTNMMTHICARKGAELEFPAAILFLLRGRLKILPFPPVTACRGLCRIFGRPPPVYYKQFIVVFPTTLSANFHCTNIRHLLSTLPSSFRQLGFRNINHVFCARQIGFSMCGAGIFVRKFDLANKRDPTCWSRTHGFDPCTKALPSIRILDEL